MHLTVNGRSHEVAATSGERLLTTLHESLHLTGTKFGCGHGECGACTVLLNGKLAYSCIVLTEACEGATVSTVEGLADGETLSALQRAFIAHDAAQCGYCTPGQLIAAAHLLGRNANPTEADIVQAMSGNLCRCGTYPKITTAILAVARGDFIADSAAGSTRAP